MSYKFLTLVTVSFILTACHADLKSNPEATVNPQEARLPEFSSESLGGQIFGSTWKAQSAFIRQNSLDGKLVYIDLYPQKTSSAEACSSLFFGQTPYAWIAIPANYTASADYKTDLDLDSTSTTKYPFSFVRTGFTLTASQSRVFINKITTQGFNASFYGKGIDSDSKISEINGQIDVIDCLKTAP